MVTYTKHTDMLKDIVNDKQTLLVDVRTPEEFNYGSAHGAINIPLDRIPYELEKFRGKANVVVFCRSGNRSAQAKYFLEQSGITPVYNAGTWEDVMDMQS